MTQDPRFPKDSRFVFDPSASISGPSPGEAATPIDLPEEWTELFADDLRESVPEATRDRALRARLAERIGRSRRGMRGVRTVRSRDGEWLPFKEGIRYKLLTQDEKVRSVLVQFDPGASLPAHRHGHHEECVVLEGGLRMGDLELKRLDYHVAPSGSRHAGLSSPGGATIFLRGAAIGSGRDAVREVIGAWLPGGRERPQTVFGDQLDGWFERAPGVSTKLLYAPTESAAKIASRSPAGPAANLPTTSRLVRLAGGVTLQGLAPFGQDQECLMLAGEAYFGDILLRPGEYWMARAGACFDAVESSAGALFFVHGAMSS